jgi:F-type H+-transporting ATPase subunit b
VRRAARLVAALAAALVPAAALAAGGEEGESAMTHVWEWLNLALLLGVLFYFGRKPVLAFFGDRRSRIEKELESAESLLREAQLRLAEWSARAAGLDGEMEQIKRVAREAAEREAARVVADAHAAADRIRRDAASAVEREAARAKARLRQEAADLAVASAEGLLREQVQPADGERLFDEFVGRIEQPAARSR